MAKRRGGAVAGHGPTPLRDHAARREAKRRVTVCAERYRLAHNLAGDIMDAPLLGTRAFFVRE